MINDYRAVASTLNRFGDVENTRPAMDEPKEQPMIQKMLKEQTALLLESLDIINDISTIIFGEPTGRPVKPTDICYMFHYIETNTNGNKLLRDELRKLRCKLGA